LLTDSALHESALLDSGEVETEEARKRRKRVALYLLQPTSLPWRFEACRKDAAQAREARRERRAGCSLKAGDPCPAADESQALGLHRGVQP